MAATPATLRQDLQRAQASLAAACDAGIRAIALEMDRRVRERTPVRTGAARANWRLSVGGPDTSASEGDTDVAGGRARAIAAAAGIVAGASVWITNALGYVFGLEYGASKQAPAGMARLTAAEAPLIARDFGRRAMAASLAGERMELPEQVSATAGSAPVIRDAVVKSIRRRLQRTNRRRG
jgi:hypothetical protein